MHGTYYWLLCILSYVHVRISVCVCMCVYMCVNYVHVCTCVQVPLSVLKIVKCYHGNVRDFLLDGWLSSQVGTLSMYMYI